MYKISPSALTLWFIKISHFALYNELKINSSVLKMFLYFSDLKWIPMKLIFDSLILFQLSIFILLMDVVWITIPYFNMPQQHISRYVKK